MLLEAAHSRSLAVNDGDSEMVRSIDAPSVAGAARLREMLGQLSDASIDVFQNGDPKTVHRFYEAIGLQLNLQRPHWHPYCRD